MYKTNDQNKVEKELDNLMQEILIEFNRYLI